MTITDKVLRLRLDTIGYEAVDILRFTFRDPEDGLLPDFTAGSHIDVHMVPDKLSRSYSLINAPGVRDRYEIAVKREIASRGGSSAMHDILRVGHLYDISFPRNNFPLAKDFAPSVLIGGGIGITPIYAMATKLAVDGRDFALHYAVRNRKSAALRAEIEQLPSAQIHYFDPDNPSVGGAGLDIEALVEAAPANAHLYCCGPAGMIKAFLAAAARRDPETVHVEYFESNIEQARDGGFTVELARSGNSYYVPEGKTILETLLENGMDMPNSCRDGVCGSCEVAVIAGTPEHRDMVLSAAERASNDRVLICCSGSRTPKLVLDV